MKRTRTIDLALILLAALAPDTSAGQQCYPGLPDPVLKVSGGEFTIENRAAFPEELFDRAPELPPCGANANSSRTWVDLINEEGRRFYGYCGLSSPAVLEGIRFPAASMPTARVAQSASRLSTAVTTRSLSFTVSLPLAVMKQQHI